MGMKESFHTSGECVELPPGTSALRHAGEEKHRPCHHLHLTLLCCLLTEHLLATSLPSWQKTRLQKMNRTL